MGPISLLISIIKSLEKLVNAVSSLPPLPFSFESVLVRFFPTLSWRQRNIKVTKNFRVVNSKGHSLSSSYLACQLHLTRFVTLSLKIILPWIIGPSIEVIVSFVSHSNYNLLADLVNLHNISRIWPLFTTYTMTSLLQTTIHCYLCC